MKPMLNSKPIKTRSGLERKHLACRERESAKKHFGRFQLEYHTSGVSRRNDAYGKQGCLRSSRLSVELRTGFIYITSDNQILLPEKPIVVIEPSEI